MHRTAIVEPTYPSRDVQDAANHRAVATISELAENGLSIADNIVAYAEGRLPPLVVNGNNIVVAVRKLWEEYRHERPAGWGETRFLEECEQHVTPGEIAQICGRPVLDTNSVSTSLHNLTDRSLPRGRFLLMKSNLNIINPHVPSDTVVDIPEALAALHDIHHVDATQEIKDELKEMDVQRSKYATQVQESQAVYDAAIQHGDVVELERAHRHLIAARYEYLVCYAKRLHVLTSSEDNDDTGRFSERLQKLRDDAEDAVRVFKKEKEAVKSAVEKDIKRCEEARAREAATHQAAQAACQKRKAEMETSLGGFVDRKNQLVNELLQKAAELRQVMEDQRAITQDVVEVVRAEKERQTAHEEFVAIGNQHMQRLQWCLDYCNGCEPVTKEMEEYVRDMVEQLPEDTYEKALNEIVDHEADEFLKVYRAFVFVCGELTVKKTHRLDTLERQARLAQYNRDSSMDSLDPNYKHYREELADVLAQLKAVEGVINALHATQDAGEQVFESVEDLVLTSCKRSEKPFVHPLQEFGHESVASRTRFVDRSMKYVEGEEQEIFNKRARIAEAKALVEQEQDALDRGVHAAAITASATTSRKTADSAVAAPAQIDA
ncbi:hypothetical protein JKF63_06914 [Porcisia hertigi]|uniref:Paraflagellar rod component n=1 Tax=Porcisia hertigi TaxID=2761500 RepID=A0A836YHH5_9TRYP|nr:hypothetical protein JKF63_06914 [Porcisia hertigi]